MVVYISVVIAVASDSNGGYDSGSDGSKIITGQKNKNSHFPKTKTKTIHYKKDRASQLVLFCYATIAISSSL